jgi:hypothetical protein
VRKSQLSRGKGECEPIKQPQSQENYPPQAIQIVILPVAVGTFTEEELLEKEVLEGVYKYMAGSLTKVVDGHVLTSILNTREDEIEIEKPVAELKEILEVAISPTDMKVKSGKCRDEEVLEELSTSIPKGGSPSAKFVGNTKTYFIYRETS